MEIKLDPTDLKPVIETVITELLTRFEDTDGRIAFTEEEAAGLLGVPATTLRDERLRERVEASLVGRKIRYTKRQLLDYLTRRTWKPKE